MSDAVVRGSFDTRGMEEGMKRVGKGMRSLGRSSGRRGGAAMGLLEASRAIEDFSVAGMRGALNNIPGLAMSLGAGAGLAGAASLAAVAFMQLAKMADLLADELGRLQMEAFTNEINKQIAAMEKAKDSAGLKAYVAVLQELADTGLAGFKSGMEQTINVMDEMVTAERSHQDRISQALGGLKDYEQAQLNANRASEDANRIMEQQTMLFGALQRQQQELAKAKEIDTSETEAQIRAEINAIKARKAALGPLIEKGGAEEIPSGFLEAVSKKLTDLGLGLMGEQTIAQIEKEKSLKPAMKLNEELEQQLRFQNNALSALEKEKDIRESTIKAMEKEVKATEDLGRQLDANLDKTRQTRDTEEAVAEIMKSKAMQEQMAALMKRDIRGGDFLSSQGRAGLAGNEAKTAINSLGILIESRNFLRQIARNTSGKQTATYAA